MNKTKWIVGLSIAGVMALSGTAFALNSGSIVAQSTGKTLGSTPIMTTKSQRKVSNTNGVSMTIANSPTTSQSIDTTTPSSSSDTKNYGINGFAGGYGMMGGYGANGTVGGYGMMGGFGTSNPSYQIIDNNNANDAMSNSLENAVIDKNNNSITFKGQDVNIVLFGGPQNADEKFVVGGLVDPTINVSKGSKVTLTLINEDEGMPHGMEIIASPPPYVYMSMMQGPIYPGAYVPIIPQAANESNPTVSTTFMAPQSGTYYYICQVPGHASKGMYGEIVIR